MNIFFDLDETLIHSSFESWCDKQLHLQFESAFGPEDYWTHVHPQALEVLEHARGIGGPEKVFMLTIATREYAHLANDLAGLGFSPDQIFAREDLDANCPYTKDPDSELKPCPHIEDYNVLIDNLPQIKNLDKTRFIACNGYLKAIDYTPRDFTGSFGEENFLPCVKEFLAEELAEFEQLSSEQQS